jgi:hypothetical protein
MLFFLDYCKTSVITGQKIKDDFKWTITVHGCGLYDKYPHCKTVKWNFKDYDGHKNIVETKCSCGKDLCNFGDARGGKYIWISFGVEDAQGNTS